MLVLNNIPLAGILIGLFLLVLIVPNRRGLIQNKRTKALLITIIGFNIHLQLDGFLYYHGHTDSDWLGLSYLYHHLYGLLLYLFTISVFSLNDDTKRWKNLIAIYTVLRFGLLFYLEETNLETDVYLEKEFEWIYIVDYYIGNLVNIFFLLKARVKLREMSFAVTLTKMEQMHYNWLKNLLLISAVIYAVAIESSAIAIFDKSLELLQLKIESLILTFFFFTLSYLTIRFPVFSVYGDYRELSNAKTKYAKSSLNHETRDILWKQIHHIMSTQKPYQNPEYRLNQLAKEVNQSLHHVSQTINEKEGISFSELINRYRINEAKTLLTSSRTSHLTILALAHEVGFNSKTAFYNAFKKHTGQTPSDFKSNQD